MKLYRFRKLETAEDFNRLKEIIETEYFWCSNFWDLNDPMEGIYKNPYILPEKIKEIFDEKSRYKICSFSGKKGLSNPLLWGYYANGYHGVAIEIEVNEDNPCIAKIKYVTEDVFKIGLEDVKAILSRKLCDWMHENEYRFLTQSNSNLHKIGKITKIYFGKPYADLNNTDNIYNASKKLKAYDSFKNKLKEICDSTTTDYVEYDKRLQQRNIEDNTQYVSFDKLIEDCKEFYNNFETINTFTADNKELFFKEKEKTLSKLIVLTHNVNWSIDEMQIYYALMGLTFELLIKLCVLKYDWDNYVEEYRCGKHKLEHAKISLLENLKTKINEQQHLRVHQILRLIQVQRNNFLHNPFKGLEHYAVPNQLFLCIALLVHTYNISINEDAKNVIIENTKKYDEYSGMDFEDVGLYEYVEKLKK